MLEETEYPLFGLATGSVEVLQGFIHLLKGKAVKINTKDGPRLFLIDSLSNDASELKVRAISDSGLIAPVSEYLTVKDIESIFLL